MLSNEVLCKVLNKEASELPEIKHKSSKEPISYQVKFVCKGMVAQSTIEFQNNSSREFN